MRVFYTLIFLLLSWNSLTLTASPPVRVGIDVLLSDEQLLSILRNKRIGLITNHTAINSEIQSTRSLMKNIAAQYGFTLAALFAPEHGLYGSGYAFESIADQTEEDGIPIYSLYGANRRPTPQMLNKIDLLVYDMQDIGSRSYTYIATLFYVMEEAAAHGIPVLVLDRPNPINGLVVDGPMLEEQWRSIVGYINVPYCHGMTVAELAQFFNQEYKINCALTVVPMRGWKRSMTFADTGLSWVPTSPNIPESTTPCFYPITGMLGELQIVSIGIGYTLPFKLVGAPWIDAEVFAKQLNSHQFPGVFFLPFHFKPFFGRFALKECHGVQILITDSKIYKPVSTQYLLFGVLKNLYPTQMREAIKNIKPSCKELFCKTSGTDKVYRLLQDRNTVIWPLRALHQKEREEFSSIRRKYLIPAYAE